MKIYQKQRASVNATDLSAILTSFFEQRQASNVEDSWPRSSLP